MKPITAQLVRKSFPKRDQVAQKWDYGHCLVVAGSRRLLGAAVLTTKAALRGGAGLVTLATPRNLQSLVYSQVLEALTLPLEETPEGTVHEAAVDTIESYIKDRGVTSVVMGPGLTRQESTARAIWELARRVNLPMVLDADAINVKPPLESNFFRCLTPHRREFARLIGCAEEDVLQKGVSLAKDFIKNYTGVALVLKGYRTKIFFGDSIWENPTGNPGMAKGGCGDILAGLIGAFLAQKRFSFDHQKASYIEAVLSAVYLHGLSGDLASRSLTQQAMNAEDLIAHLPLAYRKVGIA